MHVAATSRWLPAALMLAITVTLATPVSAQSTGMAKGKVVDGQGQPVEGAKVVIEFLDGVNRKYEVKSNKRGEFIQIGLQPGNYRLTASKEGVGSQSFDVRVRLGAAAEVTFQLVPGGQGAMSKEDAEKFAAFKKAFEEGVAATTGGKYDEAIAKFAEAEALMPDCYACKFNTGGAYFQKQDYEKAEQSYKAASALKPDSAEPYNALANMYNSQRKFELAAQMTEEATKRAAVLGAGGGDADSLFNQGVIFWNAGKIADAKRQFEEALKVRPGHADAHYWVGMASLNEGKVADAIPHFEEYLKLAPNGQYAKDVTNALAALKK